MPDGDGTTKTSRPTHLTRSPHNFVVQILYKEGSVIEYFDDMPAVLEWIKYQTQGDEFRRIAIGYIGEK